MKPMSPTEVDAWFRTFYAAAEPYQRTIMREVIEQLLDCHTVDEVSLALFKRRFGKPSPQLAAALDELEYEQAARRQQHP